jgi:hypothetical protein
MEYLTMMTELDAVNAMLTVIGESPISSLSVSGNANVAIAQQVLRETAREVQERGWSWNTDKEYQLLRNDDDYIKVPLNALLCVPDGDYATTTAVQRGLWLYDTDNNTYEWDDDITCTITRFLDYDQMPQAARHYIAIRAARVFASRVLGADSVERYTEDDEVMALASCTRAELRQMRANFLTGSWTTYLGLLNRRNYPY